MALLCDIDDARDERPLAIPPREGIDYKTCWTCGRCLQIPKSCYPVKIDLGYCDEEEDVITDVHEPNDCDEWEPRC